MRTEVEAVLLSNETTDAEYRVICEAFPIEYETDKFVHVEAFHKITERIKGETYATWTVLCYRDDLEAGEAVVHPYIVGTLVAHPEGFTLMGRDYCTSYDEALKIYKTRL